VSVALSLLRSWLREEGLRALEIFGEWDQGGNFTLSCRELGEGLETLGLSLTPSLTTLVFDHMAEGYKLTYDEFKIWLESTSQSYHMSPEERKERACRLIQKAIRSRLERKYRPQPSSAT
jgi:hypothetical protein